MGSRYTSGHAGKTPDQVTVTEVAPNERFRFNSVMPNGMSFDWIMTVAPEGQSTVVTCKSKNVKCPLLMLPLMPLIPLLARDPEKKFLSNMKAELEAGV